MTKPKKITVKFVDSKATTKGKKESIKKVMEEKTDSEGCAFC